MNTYGSNYMSGYLNLNMSNITRQFDFKILRYCLKRIYACCPVFLLFYIITLTKYLFILQVKKHKNFKHNLI